VIFSSGLLSRNAAGALIRVSTPIPPEQLDKARQNAFAMLQETLHHLDKVLR
jgi:hypothetical protein